MYLNKDSVAEATLLFTETFEERVTPLSWLVSGLDEARLPKQYEMLKASHE